MIVVNLGVLLHPGHDVLHSILDTTTLNENKLVYSNMLIGELMDENEQKDITDIYI